MAVRRDSGVGEIHRGPWNEVHVYHRRSLRDRMQAFVDLAQHICAIGAA
jgi:hypothetical protein